MKQFSKIAFTLIELLVVIAIIGILSGLIIVSLSGTTQSANVAKYQIFSNSLRNSLMANLVSEWKFDQINSPSTDQTPDSWGGGNVATLRQEAYGISCDSTHCPQLQTSNCIYGNCLSFDGMNDYVALNEGDNLKVDEITVELWVNPTIATNGSPIRTNVTNKYYVAFHANGNFAWHVRKSDNTGSYIYSSVAVSAGKWHHIAATYSKSQAFQRLYLDGVKVADTSNFSWTPLVVSGSYGWVVGYADWAASYAFYKGLIDNVRFYSAPLSISQVREQYYAGLNKLLAGGIIDIKEYNQRLKEISLNQ